MQVKVNDRKKIILREVINNFIRGAEPVSSKQVAFEKTLQLSTATIRKEMAELEEMGYLTHPYTSSGRIPTDKGYRFYVDNIMSSNRVSENQKTDSLHKDELKEFNLSLNKDMEMETVLQKSSEILARFTNYLSMIVAPAIHHSKFKHIEILKFDKEEFLMVLITDTGRVHKRKFTLGGGFNDLDMQAIANMLNAQLRDSEIVNISVKDIKVSNKDSTLIFLLNKVIELIKSCVEENLLYNRIFVHGASVILQQPEFIDLKKIQDIISFIEDEYLLMNLLLDLSRDNDFVIKIGSELFSGGTSDLSLVASKYRVYGNSTGAIGILGPKRMDYCRVINTLNLFKKNLTDIFSSRA